MLFRQIIAWLLVPIAFFANILGLGASTEKDTEEAYFNRLNSIGIYENTQSTAIPQTVIRSIIEKHLNAPLPEGKTQKKVLVIGYDGCRADSMVLLKDSRKSAITTLLDDGGKAYISYCGGVNYPAPNTQATSTAPGWCSMLTGEWADVHGITNNGQPKSNDHLTCLTTLVEDGTIDSSAFYVSWDGHFSGENTTYINEVNYVKEKGINTLFSRAKSDVGTFNNVKRDIKQKDCTDFIFTIFEFCDHSGHSLGFGTDDIAYKNAFYNAELAGYKLIKAVKNRDTFDTEDWLFIITSDHGGYGTGHGGPTVQERMMFIVTSKDLIDA